MPPLEDALKKVQIDLHDIKKCNKSTIKFNKDILHEKVTSIAIDQLKTTNEFLEQQLAKHKKRYKELCKPKNIGHGPASKLFNATVKLRNALRDYNTQINELSGHKEIVEARLNEFQKPASETQDSPEECKEQKTTEHKEAASQENDNSGSVQPEPTS